MSTAIGSAMRTMCVLPLFEACLESCDFSTPPFAITVPTCGPQICLFRSPVGLIAAERLDLLGRSAPLLIRRSGHLRGARRIFEQAEQVEARNDSQEFPIFLFPWRFALHQASEFLPTPAECTQRAR